MPADKTAEKKPSGGRRTISVEEWSIYFLARNDGMSINAAAKKAGISRATAMRAKDPTARQSNEYRRAKAVFDEQHPKPVVAEDGLSDEARRALEDFAYFRLRYFGRYSTPWQVDAANQIVKLLASEDKEYLVQNVAPGAGKSTLWHDIICWLIVRDRSVRIMIGSATERTARPYGSRIMNSLERTEPLKNDSKLVEMGVMADAQATLTEDFGAFKPPQRDRWRKEEFVVQQADGTKADDKEATVSTYGRDGGFLGGRFDFVLWDDLVTTKVLRTAEGKEALENWWDSEAESRLEPGGLMVLQGQRLSSEDLYRYCLNKPGGYLDDEDGEPIVDPDSRMYRHIVYKTHYPEHCKDGSHKRSAPAYDPQRPNDSGCLIDPRRIPWVECARLMANKAERWLVVYQQEDTDPETVLVQKLWVAGGKDTETGIEYKGCWDHDRSAGLIPKGLTKPWLLAVSVDPSPKKYWAVEAWLYHHETRQRMLIDLARDKMTAPDFIRRDPHTLKFYGLIEDWWQNFKAQGHPFRHLILEENSATFLIQQQHFKDWLAARGVHLIIHTTARNKNDPDYGVGTLAPEWEFGRVRLPGNRRDKSRGTSMALVGEATTYPEGRTDDTIMAQWFFEYTLQRVLLPDLLRPEVPPQRKVPSWLGGRKRA